MKRLLTEKQKEEARIRAKAYYIKNKDKCLVAFKEYREANKDTIQVNKKKWYQDNKEYCYDKSRTYKSSNLEKSKEYDKTYREQNKESAKLYSTRYQKEKKELIRTQRASYRKLNRGILNAINGFHRCSKLQATPIWLTKFDLDYMKHIYIQARELQKLDNIRRHVDHLVPLRGETVCGLHVPWNLQILTAEENISKNNRLI